MNNPINHERATVDHNPELDLLPYSPSSALSPIVGLSCGIQTIQYSLFLSVLPGADLQWTAAHGSSASRSAFRHTVQCWNTRLPLTPPGSLLPSPCLSLSLLGSFPLPQPWTDCTHSLSLSLSLSLSPAPSLISPGRRAWVISLLTGTLCCWRL